MDVLQTFDVKSKGDGAAPPSRHRDLATVVPLPTALTPEQRCQQVIWRRHATAFSTFLEEPTRDNETRARDTGDRWIAAYLGEGQDAEQARRLLEERLFNIRLPVLAKHLHGLGVRPLAECLLEIAGNDDGAHITLLTALERYSKLTQAMVAAAGADVFPPVPLHEVPQDHGGPSP